MIVNLYKNLTRFDKALKDSENLLFFLLLYLCFVLKVYAVRYQGNCVELSFYFIC